MTVRPVKTQISLGIRPVWSESLLYAWRNLGSLATHWAHSEESDQTGRMPRLIWVFAGCTVILLVQSWGGSFFLSPYVAEQYELSLNWSHISEDSLSQEVGHIKLSICCTLHMQIWSECGLLSLKFSRLWGSPIKIRSTRSYVHL